MTHVTCRLTAKNRDQFRNPMLGNRVWGAFTFLAVIVGGKVRPTHSQTDTHKTYTHTVSVSLSVCLSVFMVSKDGNVVGLTLVLD